MGAAVPSAWASPRLPTAQELGLPSAVNGPCDTGASVPPVVLIHGTFAHARRAFSSLAPALLSDRQCVYALNYGQSTSLKLHGVADVTTSAAEVTAFVQAVLSHSGASKVSLVGHSQGGLLAFMVASHPLLEGKIHRLLAVAPSVGGTQRVTPRSTIPFCPACEQQSAQSPLIQSLRGAPLNPPGVRTLVLATSQDLVVTPVASQFVHEPGVRNLLLQDLHPTVLASHSGLMHVPQAVAIMRQFLKDDGPVPAKP